MDTQIGNISERASIEKKAQKATSTIRFIRYKSLQLDNYLVMVAALQNATLKTPI